jgi:hypothetical protein
MLESIVKNLDFTLPGTEVGGRGWLGIWDNKRLSQQAAKVAGGRGENGVDSIALPIPHVIAADPTLEIEVTGHGLDGAAPAQSALDGRAPPPLLA